MFSIDTIKPNVKRENLVRVLTFNSKLVLFIRLRVGESIK